MITVIGLGFVGLTTALGFCEKGFKVFGFDIDKEKKNNLKNFKVPFYEPGLPDALKKHLNVNFFIIDEFKGAIEQSEIIFYCVGTPCKKDGNADLKHLLDAIENSLNVIEDSFKVLVIKSTIPPATTSEEVKHFIEKHGFTVGKDIGLANNPEFLREGYAWDDFLFPDRIVIGAEDEKTIEILRKVYKPFNTRFHVVSYNTSEFIKYISNTLLATLISYANEMSMIAHTIGDINIIQAFNILHEDKRWSGSPAKMTSYVYPGCGFGGYCLPKDTMAMFMHSKLKGYDACILNSVITVNERIKDFVVQRIIRNISKEETIGILGLAFKPNSDDIRDTPSKTIIEKLLENGFDKIVAYDPIANNAFASTYSLNISYANSLDEIVEHADCLILLTAWDEFKKNKEKLKSKKLFDFRHFL
jgi:UDPglucose 6-dehydrogenase